MPGTGPEGGAAVLRLFYHMAGLITRRVPLDRAAEAIETNQDVKVVITLGEGG